MKPNTEPWLPIIEYAICTGCGDCVAVCPTDTLALRDGVAALDKPELCIYCDLCEAVCPVDAVSLPFQVVVSAESD